jgi:hypothetical protein
MKGGYPEMPHPKAAKKALMKPATMPKNGESAKPPRIDCSNAQIKFMGFSYPAGSRREDEFSCYTLAAVAANLSPILPLEPSRTCMVSTF